MFSSCFQIAVGIASVVSWSLGLACSLERLLGPQVVHSFEQFLTRVLSQNVLVYFPQTKDIEEIPGGRTHPGKRTVLSNYPEQPSCSPVLYPTTNVLSPSCHPKDWLDLGQMAAYHEGSMEGRLIPRCNMGLNRRVKGKGTLARRLGGRGIRVASPSKFLPSPFNPQLPNLSKLLLLVALDMTPIYRSDENLN